MRFGSFYNEGREWRYLEPSVRGQAASLKCWGTDTLFLFSSRVRLPGWQVPGTTAAPSALPSFPPTLPSFLYLLAKFQSCICKFVPLGHLLSLEFSP